MKKTQFEVLNGETITKISGNGIGSEKITFITSNGHKYVMYHEQDCCEEVSVEEVIGDWEDIIGQEILLAEESIGGRMDYGGDMPGTWTFYKLGTIKGSLTIRWYGISNGYYSESVDFVRIE